MAAECCVLSLLFMYSLGLSRRVGLLGKLRLDRSWRLRKGQARTDPTRSHKNARNRGTFAMELPKQERTPQTWNWGVHTGPPERNAVEPKTNVNRCEQILKEGNRREITPIWHRAKLKRHARNNGAPTHANARKGGGSVRQLLPRNDRERSPGETWDQKTNR